MPVFAYAGTARGGKSVTAEINADTRESAIEQLRSQGITVRSIEEKKKAKSLFGEKKQKITDKDLVIFTRQFATMINAAMVYPAAIVGVAIIVVSVLMVWVIPIFAKMFTDFGGTLPTPTLLVIGISDFMQKYIIFMVIAAGVGLYGLKRYYATPGGRLRIDALTLKLPVMGDLIRKIAVAQFTRTFGTLLQSGVPIMEGLDIVARLAR